MEYEAQKIGTVEGLGDIYRAVAPLDKQLTAFAKKGIYTLAAPDEVAQIRLAGVSNDYSRTNIAPVAIKGGKTILVRNSPLMHPLMAALAVNAHANRRYFETNKEAYEVFEALAKSQDSMAPEDKHALIVSQIGDFNLTPEMAEAQFILRKQTAPYFTKFTQGTIPFQDIAASSDNTTFNYLWFNYPRSESGLDCGYRSLNVGNRAFGVLETAVGSAQKNGYTLTEIEKANSQTVKEVLGGTPALENALGEMLTRGLIGKLRAQ